MSRFESSERRKGRKLRGDNDGHEKKGTGVSGPGSSWTRELVVMLPRAVE